MSSKKKTSHRRADSDEKTEARHYETKGYKYSKEDKPFGYLTKRRKHQQEAYEEGRTAQLAAEEERVEAALDEALRHARGLTAEIRAAREELKTRLDAA